MVSANGHHYGTNGNVWFNISSIIRRPHCSAQLIAGHNGSKRAFGDRLSKLADRRPSWNEIAQSVPLWHTLHTKHRLAMTARFCTCGPSTVFRLVLISTSRTDSLGKYFCPFK
jgi:hypothetical protein